MSKKIMFNDKYSLTKAVIELLKEMTRREPIFDKLKNPRTEFDVKGHLCLYDGDVLVHRSRFARNEVVAIAQRYEDVINDILIAQAYETDIVALVYKRHKGWNNKMFVNADLMPHQICITDIKGERLQDISDEDCLKEGVLRREIMPFSIIEIKYQVPKTTIYKDTPREAFAALIDKVSGKGTWERNPWVFAYSFELIK